MLARHTTDFVRNDPFFQSLEITDTPLIGDFRFATSLDTAVASMIRHKTIIEMAKTFS
jgi:hypothetical protein